MRPLRYAHLVSHGHSSLREMHTRHSAISGRMTEGDARKEKESALRGFF